MLLVFAACSSTEDWLDMVPLDEAIPADKQGNLSAATCKNICRPEREIDSINFCKLATLEVKPYIVCEMTEPQYKETEVALRFPKGLDPNTRGPIDLKWCPHSACAPPFVQRLGVDGSKIVVVGCRVQERPKDFDPNERFVLCSYRTKHEFSAR